MRYIAFSTCHLPLLSMVLSWALLIPTISNAASKNELPDLGTAAINSLSLEKEQAYGDAYMRVIRASAPILHDPVLNQYLSELGNKIVSNASDVKTPFHFFLIKNDEINAFAFFGGHVGVHTSLFLNASNESELASVLAHEVTHVTQRHLARTFEAQQKMQPATLAGYLGSILLTLAVPQAGMAAVMTVQSLSSQTQINYTRQYEQEADRIGMQTLVNAGFDPNAAATFFDKLASRFRFATKPPQMLMTHPLTEARISEARDRAKQYPIRSVPDNLAFQLAKARIQVRFSNNSAEVALQWFEQQLQQQTYPFKASALYGKALALLQLKNDAEAEKIVRTLLANDENNLFYLDTLTDILLSQQRYTDAIATLQIQHKVKPTSQVINANLANSYLEAGKAPQAIPILETMVFLSPQNPLPYQLLTQAYNKIGDQALAYISLAEMTALEANYKNAIEHLHAAYKASADKPLQQARIEARIAELKAADKALAALK